VGITYFRCESSEQVDKLTVRIGLACGVLIAALLVYVQLLNRVTEPIIQSETTGISMSRPGVHYSSCGAIYRETNPYPVTPTGGPRSSFDAYVSVVWASEHEQRASICRTWERTAWGELFIVLVAATGLAAVNEQRKVQVRAI